MSPSFLRKRGAHKTMQRITINTTINGTAHSFEVEPRLLLVDLIRDKAGLKGTHIGCDTGNCGACTVIMDGLTVKSCQVLAPRANGAELHTVEGLARDGALHPIQEAFWECDGLECGFCTPGHADDDGGVSRRKTAPDRRGDTPRLFRQPVPLHRLPQHHQGGEEGGPSTSLR